MAQFSRRDNERSDRKSYLIRSYNEQEKRDCPKESLTGTVLFLKYAFLSYWWRHLRKAALLAQKDV